MGQLFSLMLFLWIGGSPNPVLETDSSGSYAFSEGQTLAPSCNIIKKEKLHFSSKNKKDTVIVSIVGKLCSKAVFTFRILDNDGNELYKYTAPFSQLTAISTDDLEQKYAEGLVKDTLEKEGYLNSSNLPPYAPPQEFNEKYFNVVAIPREQYEKFRKKFNPLLSHSTHYESWVYLVYDDATGKVIIIMEGGV